MTGLHLNRIPEFHWFTTNQMEKELGAKENIPLGIFYPEKNEIVILKHQPYVKATITHELIHAWIKEHFPNIETDIILEEALTHYITEKYFIYTKNSLEEIPTCPLAYKEQYQNYVKTLKHKSWGEILIHLKSL